jgi:hypothetical protein
MPLAILSDANVSVPVRNFAALAAVFGVEAQVLATPRGVHAEPGAAFVVDVGGLARRGSAEIAASVRALARVPGTTILLLATDAEPSTRALLRTLTDGAVDVAAVYTAASTVAFASAHRDLAAELSGFSYARVRAATLALKLDEGRPADIVMTLDGAPAFVRLRSFAASLLVWATPAVFDPTRPLQTEREFEDCVDAYVPAIAFLRLAFGASCWVSGQKAATLVIDDPLVKRRYGYIDFPRLLESARRSGYHVNLAYIPWNHWRSSAKAARLFVDHADCFSLCYHGCDHTKDEYSTADYELLLWKNSRSIERMRSHEARTGLACEPIMVCPQERYSREAMRSFSDGRVFLAIANTACIAKDLDRAEVTGADLLLPAQDCFDGIAVFKRHYLGSLPAFALGLFLGKPAILATHHDQFRDGPSAVEQFAAELQRISPGIEWMSLATVAMKTALVRRSAAGRVEMRVFSDAFEFAGEAGAEYRILRRLPAAASLEGITVNGERVSFERSADFVAFNVSARSPGSYSVRINPKRRDAAVRTMGIGYRTLVGLRRALSEVRDGLIVRNRPMMALAQSLARLFGQTAR